MADLPPSAPPMGAAYQMFDFSDKSADFSTGSPACSINGVGSAIPSAQAVDLFRQPGVAAGVVGFAVRQAPVDVAERSEEHTSDLQSLMRISYAVFCANKKTNGNT